MGVGDVGHGGSGGCMANLDRGGGEVGDEESGGCMTNLDRGRGGW